MKPYIVAFAMAVYAMVYCAVQTAPIIKQRYVTTYKMVDVHAEPEKPREVRPWWKR